MIPINKIVANILLVLSALALKSAHAQAENTSDEIIKWNLTMHNLIMQYEKPSCIKFFWTPDGCPESSTALEFKEQCILDPEFINPNYLANAVTHLIPKVDWYQKNRKYIKFNRQVVTSNKDGLVDVTSALKKELDIDFDLKLTKNLVGPPILKKESSSKPSQYFVDFVGEKLTLFRRNGENETDLIVTEEFQSLVLSRQICPKNHLALQGSGNSRQFDFAYQMLTFTGQLVE